MALINNLYELVYRIIDIAYNVVFHFDPSYIMPARIDQLINQSPIASDTRSVLEIISLSLSIVFGLFTGLAVAGKKALAAKPQPVGVAGASAVIPVQAVLAGPMKSKWGDIMVHMDSPRENDWKQAVMDADKLVDSALQQAGFTGETFGDRLTNIDPSSLVSLDGLWWAHRIRNRVAHEVDYFLRYTEARQAISYYQVALEELKMI